MNQYKDEIDEYLNSVCSQVRWKKSHEYIKKELSEHIEDQTNAFISSGIDENTALKKAISEMGDSIIVGTEFDRVYRPKINLFTLISLLIIVLISISAKAYITYICNENIILENYIFEFLFAIIAFTIGYILDFTILSKHTVIIFIGFIISVILSSILFNNVNGINIICSYIFILFPLIFSGIIYNMRNTKFLGFIFCFIILIFHAIMGLLLNTGIVSIFINLIVCILLINFSIKNNWFNSKKIPLFLITNIPVVLLFLFTLFKYTYKFKYLINPFLEPEGRGYITATSFSILSKSEFIGNSTNNIIGILPNTYIFVFLINYVGWISFFLIVFFIFAFLLTILFKFKTQLSFLGKIVSISIIYITIVQSIFFILNNLGIIFAASALSPFAFCFSRIGILLNFLLYGIMMSAFKCANLSFNSHNNFQKNYLKS